MHIYNHGLNSFSAKYSFVRQKENKTEKKNRTSVIICQVKVFLPVLRDPQPSSVDSDADLASSKNRTSRPQELQNVGVCSNLKPQNGQNIFT